MKSKDIKEVGWYAVVHYGPHGTNERPYFLARHHSCGFTVNMETAQLFDTVGGAESAKNKAEEIIRTEWIGKGNPPLLGQCRVIRLLSQIVKPLEI